MSDYNDMYYELVQTSDYPQASEKKEKNKEDTLIQGLYMKMEDKSTKVKQSLGSKLVNVVKTHRSDSRQGESTTPKTQNWRHNAPKA